MECNSVEECTAAYGRYQEAAGLETGDRLLIGHQAGDYQRYPLSAKDLTAENLAAAGSYAVRDVASLIDRAFETLGLTAVEIDVGKLRDVSQTEVYVIHDRPDAKDLQPGGARAYLKRNTLEKVLAHFYWKSHHRRGRWIFIELKTDKEMGVGEADRDLVERTVSVVHQAAAGRDSVNVGFASFNYEVLELAHDEAGALELETYWILNTSRWLRHVGRLNGKRPVSAATRKLLETSAFLTGVWFDPRWLPDYDDIFARARTARRNKTPPLKPLRYSMSTYYSTMNEFEKLMAKRPPSGRDQYHAMIFEVAPTDGRPE